MARIYNNIVHSKALQNISKLGISGLKRNHLATLATLIVKNHYPSINGKPFGRVVAGPLISRWGIFRSTTAPRFFNQVVCEGAPLKSWLPDGPKFGYIL
jgi:hypothetical protein